jgi:uncharacterized LabA/DUF88 family protein
MVQGGAQEVHYLFVDGGSLRGRLDNVARKLYGGQSFTIDFTRLARGFTKTFYYDAIPVRLPGEDEAAYHVRVKPQRDLLDTAAGVDGLHVYEGDARRRRKVGLEQKKVDVMIAVDMLTHTFRRNMHEATLLTGDNDFKPLIDALVHEGMFATLWFPPGETSQELINAADARKKLDMWGLHHLLTAESRSRFSIPEVLNKPPSHEPGRRIAEWLVDGVRHTLNRDGADEVVLRDGDQLNRLNIRHSDPAILRAYCKECFDIEVPG